MIQAIIGQSDIPNAANNLSTGFPNSKFNNVQMTTS